MNNTNTSFIIRVGGPSSICLQPITRGKGKAVTIPFSWIGKKKIGNYWYSAVTRKTTGNVLIKKQNAYGKTVKTWIIPAKRNAGARGHFNSNGALIINAPSKICR